MIDFALRCDRIIQEARDPKTAVILLDVVLGHGANPDPAGELVPSIGEAQRIATRENRQILFIASITGTDADPQNRTKQKTALETSGVYVASSNAEASRLAGLIVSEL
jgi:FdrA protein